MPWKSAEPPPVGAAVAVVPAGGRLLVPGVPGADGVTGGADVTTGADDADVVAGVAVVAGSSEQPASATIRTAAPTPRRTNVLITITPVDGRTYAAGIDAVNAAGQPIELSGAPLSSCSCWLTWLLSAVW
ncbi:hypothetical protein Ate02nite_84210 [Paractinoplanes tereljensis]|uniref:Uncharacterized protein n=1 Tax=Paractinoplanes tereljensis TaxID=571912 RepID=A0A919NXD7_9ACTN|nr:hypothetical protein Ate02nite_84210 [Actinoplanes tereljensis]